MSLPNDEQLAIIANLANQQVEAETAISEINEGLKDAKEHLRKIQEDLLPAAMQEFGLNEIKMESGESIEIKSGITASIPKKFFASAIGWLKTNGCDDIVKNEVKMNFGRGEEQNAEAIVQYLTAKKVSFAATKSVHASTLKAFCSEQLAKGVNIPHDIFGIFEWRKSVVKK